MATKPPGGVAPAPAAAAAAAPKPTAPLAAATPAPGGNPLVGVNGALMPPPVHNLAVRSDVVPAGRRRQSVIAGGVTKTENLIDFTKGKKKAEGGTGAALADEDDDGPNFFVLVSETSLFAGTPNVSGAIDGPALMSKFNTPSDIVVDRNQQLFVADTDNASTEHTRARAHSAAASRESRRAHARARLSTCLRENSC